MNRIISLFVLLVIVVFCSVSIAQETFTAHTLKGLDAEGRLNPVWKSVENGFVTGRYIIPDASQSVTCAPIDVRGMDYINFAITPSNPADTVSTTTPTLEIRGSVLGSASASIGGATFLFDADLSNLPMTLLYTTPGEATTQASAKLKRVDVRGIAWIQPIVTTSVADATQVLFYGGQKRQEY